MHALIAIRDSSHMLALASRPLKRGPHPLGELAAIFFSHAGAHEADEPALVLAFLHADDGHAQALELASAGQPFGPIPAPPIKHEHDHGVGGAGAHRLDDPLI